jgi:hypothetical protein
MIKQNYWVDVKQQSLTHFEYIFYIKFNTNKITIMSLENQIVMVLVTTFPSDNSLTDYCPWGK